MALKHQKAAEVSMTRRGLKCVAVSAGHDGIHALASEFRDRGVRTYIVSADDFSALYISEVA
jgi:hypothetical protein